MSTPRGVELASLRSHPGVRIPISVWISGDTVRGFCGCLGQPLECLSPSPYPSYS